MKILLSWLHDYLDLDKTPEQIADALIMAGLEVESLQQPARAISGVVVGRILTREPHPNAEKLVVCKVDVGAVETLTIVCGAPNAEPGARVPVAKIGAKLPGGFEIRRAKLRGVESFGMMCSRRELGMGEEHSGLFHLSPDAPIGEDIIKTLHLDDAIFEISITPNRGDALSHLGIARELSALFNLPLKRSALDRPDNGDGDVTKVTSVTMQALDGCPRYGARVIEGVKVGPSPAWLQRRLERCGVRPINNVVDVTNYVMLDIGQPMHAFDLDKLEEQRIVVRESVRGETIKSLDGNDRKLEPGMLVICDARHPHAIAGVMGGAVSEIAATTSRVLLESAWFKPTRVRQTARKLGMMSESSYRFERGTNIDNVPIALNLAARLLVDVAGAKPVRGLIDAYPEPQACRRLELRARRVNRVLGVNLTPQQIETLLLRLKLETRRDGDTLIVGVPPYRHDLEQEADLVEEVARLFGYNNIPVTIPSCTSNLQKPSRLQQYIAQTTEHLLGVGLHETINYSFIPREIPDVFAAGHPLALKNPMSEEQNVMRTQLLWGLYAAVKRNVLNDEYDLAMFEIGRVFKKSGAGQNEEATHLGVALSGRFQPWNWQTNKDQVNLFHLKGVLESLAARLGVAVRFTVGAHPALHPAQQFEIWADKICVGHGGRIHPTLRDHRKMPEAIYLAELNLEALAGIVPPMRKFQSLPTLPAVQRDLALVVPADVPCADLLATLREAGGPLLVASALFDVYQGKGITDGHRSLAFSFAFRTDDRTLTDAEVQPLIDAMVNAAKNKHQAQLR